MRRNWKPSVLIFLLLAALPGRSQERDVAVVVNPKNSVANLSVSDLRRLFMGEKRTWPGGQPVRLFVRAPGTPERTVLLKLTAMSEDDYKQHWTSQVFRGEAQAARSRFPPTACRKKR